MTASLIESQLLPINIIFLNALSKYVSYHGNYSNKMLNRAVHCNSNNSNSSLLILKNFK